MGLDPEAGIAHDPHGVTGEMAPIGEPLLQGIETALPASDALVRSDPVLEEVERGTGTQHPAEFEQGGIDIGDGAQREGAQGPVAGVVLERERFASESGELDGDG